MISHTAKLYRDMLRDWRAGRAFWDQRGFYRCYLLVAGHDGAVRVSASARRAPWSDLARKLYPYSVEDLHAAALREYPRRDDLTMFERLHGFDPVATDLLRAIALEEL